MFTQTERFHRDASLDLERPTACPVRFFYTSLITLDDPLAATPPPLATSSAAPALPPRPFSVYDNTELDAAWHELRRKILEHNEEKGALEERERWVRNATGPNTLQERRGIVREEGTGKGSVASRTKATTAASSSRQGAVARNPSTSVTEMPTRTINVKGQHHRRSESGDRPPLESMYTGAEASGSGEDAQLSAAGKHDMEDRAPARLFTSSEALERPDFSMIADPFAKSTTGTPFARAPSRNKLMTLGQSGLEKHPIRPRTETADSYNWDSDQQPSGSLQEDLLQDGMTRLGETRAVPQSYVPVGISRLHHVVMPQLRMDPIYWSPINEITLVVRGTWFYSDSMLPVEPEVANMLEAGYVALRPWTEVWMDELNSAVEVGALGEMKILHTLWPGLKESNLRQLVGQPTPPESRSGSIGETPSIEDKRRQMLDLAADIIDIASGPDGADNKAAGSAPYGRDGQVRHYQDAGVIYANEEQAYILRPSLQPSAYYGRRPLANYIRKGRSIGIPVTRGFDQALWDKLHPPKKGLTEQSHQGVSSSAASAPPYRRQKSDPALVKSERPKVTDLVLVIHGIGQKLSERVESFHFTPTINNFRRQFNVELGNDEVKKHLRKDMGGIMVLPVNWRSTLKFEEGGYMEGPQEESSSQFKLKDISPGTLPSVRNLMEDVLLDIPCYMSPEYQPKMTAAVIKEANRIYKLWCSHNPGFDEHGRVHLLAHSLGSLMAVDILSNQPTLVPKEATGSNPPEDRLDHFAFNTHNLFLCGSPSGLFMYLKKAVLKPREGIPKKEAQDANINPNVVGAQGQYGCLAVTNIYNILNPYDPVACLLNATVDAAYAASLKPAFIPSAASSWFPGLNPFRTLPSTTSSVADRAGKKKPSITRMPSNVELETHNFTREEIAEKRAYLLNDNGQIDFYLRYGGGPLDIQYLSMLGAHSSYWDSRDFVRFLVLEIGRNTGREGTLLPLRAVKKKGVGVSA